VDESDRTKRLRSKRAIVVLMKMMPFVVVQDDG
jgi:hypothetical protein